MKKLTPVVVALTSLVWSADASAIIGGALDPAPSAVVALSGQTSGGATGLVCTGTLVAPNVVLTARHCVEEGDPSCSDTFTGAAKYVAISITTDTNTYAVASTRVPTGAKPCGDDIALLVLSTPVPATDGALVADVRLAKAVKDETYSAVGYGWTCPDGAASCWSKGTRYRKDGLAVGCIDCRDGTWSGTSDVTCVGDSGGPAFDAQKKVLGITSVGGFGCTTAYYTRLETHEDWLRATVATETTNAGVATPSWTTGTTPDTDAGTGSPSDTDGGTSGAPSGATSSASDDGCSTSRVGAASPSALVSGFAFALAAFLVRRQRPRRAR